MAKERNNVKIPSICLKKIIRKNGSTQMFCQKGPKRVFLNGDTTDAQIGIMSLHVRCMTFADCRPQTADCRLQTADYRPQTADHRSTADCRPQIADCKLKDTKNRPNKGDTIKNITSCESEKVAKLASFPRCCWLFFTDATLY